MNDIAMLTSDLSSEFPAKIGISRFPLQDDGLNFSRVPAAPVP
jgi:hypothetical protein